MWWYFPTQPSVGRAMHALHSTALQWTPLHCIAVHCSFRFQAVLKKVLHFILSSGCERMLLFVLAKFQVPNKVIQVQVFGLGQETLEA